MKPYEYILVFLLSACPISLFPQEQTSLRLFSLDEFIDLFNGTPEKSEGFDSYPVLLKLDRERIIEGLCDFSYSDTGQVVTDIKQFATTITWDNKKIQWNSIRAEVVARYKDHKGKPLSLQLEIRPLTSTLHNGIHWVIEQVESKDMELLLGDSTITALPTSVDNENNFVALLTPGADYAEKMGNDFIPDLRTLFLYLTANRLIYLEYAEPVVYRIPLGDYTIWVSYRRRPYEAVAGWMISRIDLHQRTLFKSKPEI